MNQMLQLCKFTALLLAFSLLVAGNARADVPLVSTAVGFEFASGKYGTANRTDSWYVPFTIALSPTERLGFSLEVPYLHQSSSSVNASVYHGAAGQMTHMRKMPTMSSMGETSSSSSSATTTSGHSAAGLGDVLLKAGYVLVPEGDLMPRVRPYLVVKFPTADKGAGLGTGAFDEALVVELAKRLGDWYSFAEAGYTRQGRNPQLALKDYFSYDAGVGRAFADRFLPMVLIKGSSAPIAGGGKLLEVRLKLKYLATASTGLEAYVAKGLTASSPDYGSGLALFHDF